MNNLLKGHGLEKVRAVMNRLSQRMESLSAVSFLMALLGGISIRRRLVFFFLCLSILPIALIGWVSYSSSKDAIAGKAVKYSVESLAQTTVNLRLKLKKYEDLAMQLQINSDYNGAVTEFAAHGSAAARVKLEEAVKNTLALDEDVRTIFVGALRGNDSVGSGFDDPANIYGKMKRTSPFKAALQNKGQIIWGTFEQDIVMVKTINNFSTGDPVAVYAVVFQGYKINKLVNPSLYDASATSLKDKPYTMIVQVNGMILASPHQENVGTNIAGFLHNREITGILNGNQIQNGNLFARVQNQGVLITYQQISDHNWYFLTIATNDYLFAEIRAVGLFTFIIAIIISLIALVVSLLVAWSISRPLDKVKEAMKSAEKGNLAVKAEINARDELGELSHSFNLMTGRIGELISDTKEAVAAVSNHSQVLETNSELSAQSAAAVAAAANEISRGALEQTTETEKTASQMGELAKEIETAVSKANEVEQIITSTRALSIRSKEIVERLIQKANETGRITDTITRNIGELDASAAEIGNITEIIANIAEQTNLLGLNAAIEAARAGEAGRGFAVVAAEVNKLAAQSQEAAKTINQILQGIQGKTLASAQTAAQAHRIVAEQLQVVQSTQQAFDEIITAMGHVVHRITDVNGHIKRIDTVKNTTMNSVMSISSITQQSAASSQEVAAAIQEQTAITDQVKQMADQLHFMAAKLVSAIAQFQV